MPRGNACVARQVRLAFQPLSCEHTRAIRIQQKLDRSRQYQDDQKLPVAGGKHNSMNKTDFYAALTEKLQSFSPVPLNDLAPEDKLFSAGLLDSLNIVEIIEFVERYCGIQVNPTELSMDNFDSMASVAGYVQNKLSGKI